MKSEHQLFFEMLINAIVPTGSGPRGQSASTGSSFAGGNAGTTGDATSLPDAEGRTRREWLMGDDWTDRFYFRNWRPIDETTAAPE